MWKLLAYLKNTFSVEPQSKQLLVDVTAIACEDLGTGIQRTVRAQLLQLIKSPPPGYHVKPVYLTKHRHWHYQYAAEFLQSILGHAYVMPKKINLKQGDILYIPDLYMDKFIKCHKAGFFNSLSKRGISINILVHDLLPITHEKFFPAAAHKQHLAWLNAITNVANNLICVSQTVANELTQWLKAHKPHALKTINIVANHHGADISVSAPSKGLPENAEHILKQIKQLPSFLMVATLEPRKGHLQTIDAFEHLWARGLDINLIIVGKEGWKDLPNEHRRTIPQIIAKLKHHPEMNKRLFWLDNISDEYLEQIYATSSCLLYGSEAEGFGLPLIEAAKYKLPLIVRDIPIFREVVGKHAFYFKGSTASDLANALCQWLALYQAKQHPTSDNMPCLSWEQSTHNLLSLLK